MFGLERRMKPDWFERFDIESFDYFYVSGYQAEGENGRVILEALSRKRPDAVVVFDPVPACTSCRASASRTSAASAASSPSTPTRPSS